MNFSEKNLYQAMCGFDVISFDLFDTLIKRDVPAPQTVFSLTESMYNSNFPCGQVCNFLNERKRAEKKARKRSVHKEITLDEIYEELPYEQEIINRLKNVEIEIEQMVCVANKPMLGVYLGDFFIRKDLSSTPGAIRTAATSIKKFYQCMPEHGKIRKEDYDHLCWEIHDEIEQWQEECAAFNACEEE